MLELVETRIMKKLTPILFMNTSEKISTGEETLMKRGNVFLQNIF